MLPFAKEVKLALDLAQDLGSDIKPILQSFQPLVNKLFNFITLAVSGLLLIQIALVVLVCLLLVAVVFLIICVNPNLVGERDAVVTPTIKWMCRMMGAKPIRNIISTEEPDAVPTSSTKRTSSQYQSRVGRHRTDWA